MKINRWRKEKVFISDGVRLPVVEEFFSLQGEGFHTGKAAYFIRLGGCDIGCSWCDSRFSWNPDLHPMVETNDIIDMLLNREQIQLLLQAENHLCGTLDFLCNGLKSKNISTFIETSGAYPLSGKWDWICLSPKKNMPPVK